MMVLVSTWFPWARCRWVLLVLLSNLALCSWVACRGGHILVGTLRVRWIRSTILLSLSFLASIILWVVVGSEFVVSTDRQALGCPMPY